jgi:hypothetical protein
MPHAALRTTSFLSAVGLVLAVSVPGAGAQAARGADARALERALRLLPARLDVPVRLIDPELAADPEAIRRLDAFIVQEPNGGLRRVIYLNRRAGVFERALIGADLDVAILAAVIHHERQHLRGAGEREARRSERVFFQSLILAGCVPIDAGLRYLAELERGGPLREGPS